MQKLLRQLYFWSWVISLPLLISGAYVTYRGLDRFYVFQVRYDPKPSNILLSKALSYERDQLFQILRVKSSPVSIFNETKLRKINLYVQESRLALLESHMPQSGFDYIKARILIDGKLKKAKIKYRGDFSVHWAWDKKSLRVKTSKGTLLDGLRTFNLQTPKRAEQLNNYFSFKLAEVLGLLVPRTEIVRLFLNGQDRGVYIFVEQPSETTLRNAKLMPGDIYRGETVGKDQFSYLGKQRNVKLFDSVSLWDKVAINNHYDPESLAPLEALLGLIKSRKGERPQARLSELMDMEAWGRFSVFETLASSRHSSNSHNWRIYYDPWRGKFLPLVWDPVGWMWDPYQGRSGVVFDIVTTKLHELLFLDADFLRARNSAFREFFHSSKDAHFLELVSDTIELMETEIETDPFLRPANSKIVAKEMYKLGSEISSVFDLAKKQWSAYEKLDVNFHYHGSTLDLLVNGNRPVEMIRIIFDKDLNSQITSEIAFETLAGFKVTDLSEAVDLGSNSVTLHVSLMPDIVINFDADKESAGEKYKMQSGYYQISFNGLEKNTGLMRVEIDYGDGWIRAQPVDSITPKIFSQLYDPVTVVTSPQAVVWSGEVTLEGHRTLNRPLVIEPGTTVSLGPGATVVLRHRLTAKGTREAPIRFVPTGGEQESWGAIVLLGPGADDSTLSHCEMSGGSGHKGDLFEYSAMLSIHDVKGVAISDCKFRDNRIVDDMVHTVYAGVSFERVYFENALSDALDLDISTARISDSHFTGSGNDAVDLMTTQATIIGCHFSDNGDKGISVGENSRLYAVNNTFTKNVIGVQSKDRSAAILFNQTFIDNGTALHAYKKNWRYGEGGVIFLGKSSVSGSDISAMAEKRSAIQIFDSYVKEPVQGKRVDMIAVDNDNSRVRLKREFLPEQDQINTRLVNPLRSIPAELLEQVNKIRRGNGING